MRLILAVSAAVLAVWACYSAAGRSMRGAEGFADDAKPPAAHPAAPDVTLKDVATHQKVSLAALRGKVVLLDFWATWCGPCRQAMPGLEKVYQQKHSKGFEVMGVALESDNGEKVPNVVKDLGVTYPAGMPTNMGAVQALLDNVGAGNSIPVMVLVDKQGRIRNVQTGYSPALDHAIADQVDKLLAE